MKLTRLTTLYVPDPLLAPPESYVVQLPPPATFFDGPPKVPVPVSVILVPSGALADAKPPDLIGPGGAPPVKLMMSQRIVSPVAARFAWRSGDAKLAVATRPTTSTATAR